MNIREVVQKATDFIEGNINYFFKRQNTPPHIREQILYRMIQCRGCTLNNKCVHCGCSTPAMYFAPDKVDSKSKWPPFFYDKEKWKVFKNAMNPKFFSLIRSNMDIYKIYKNLWV